MTSWHEVVAEQHQLRGRGAVAVWTATVSQRRLPSRPVGAAAAPARQKHMAVPRLTAACQTSCCQGWRLWGGPTWANQVGIGGLGAAGDLLHDRCPLDLLPKTWQLEVRGWRSLSDSLLGLRTVVAWQWTQPLPACSVRCHHWGLPHRCATPTLGPDPPLPCAAALFNRIAGQQVAIVHDFPGVTRDRWGGTRMFGDSGWQAPVYRQPIETWRTMGSSADSCTYSWLGCESPQPRLNKATSPLDLPHVLRLLLPAPQALHAGALGWPGLHAGGHGGAHERRHQTAQGAAGGVGMMCVRGRMVGVIRAAWHPAAQGAACVAGCGCWGGGQGLGSS